MPNTPINNLIVQAAGTPLTGLLMGNGASPVSAAIAANVSAALDLIGATQGNVLYRSATGWTVLAPGTAGQFLRTAGAGANPTWAAAGGAGDVVGPASAVDNRLATYSGTTGKLIKDASGITAVSGVLTSNTLISLAAGGTNQDITIIPSGSGKVQITAGAPATVFTQSSPKLMIVGEAQNTIFNGSTASGTPTNRNLFQYFRSRGTLATPTVIVTGDYVCSMNFGAYDGSLMQTAATIDIISEGTITAGQTPLKIVMATGLSAAGKADRFTLNSAGLLRLHAYGLGALQSDASGNVTAGALPATLGGTGQTAYTVGDLLYASSTTALSKLAAVASGQVLVSAGTGTAPAWSGSPSLSGNLLVGGFLRMSGYSGDATQGLIQFGSGAFTNYQYFDGSTLAWRLSSSDRAVLSTSGLSVIGTLSGSFLDFGGTSASLGNFNRAGTDGTALAFFKSGVGVGTIAVTGSATSYNTSSDIRLKTNIRAMQDSGKIIDALHPILFDWKNGSPNTYGFIAQETYKVFPQAVTKGDDGETITQQWAMDASKFMPVVVSELQSLRRRVAKLESA